MHYIYPSLNTFCCSFFLPEFFDFTLLLFALCVKNVLGASFQHRMPQPDDRRGPSSEGVLSSPSFLNTGVMLSSPSVSGLENRVPPSGLRVLFLTAVKYFSLPSGLGSLTMMCLGLNFFGYPVWNLLSFLNLFLTKSEKFSSIFSVRPLSPMRGTLMSQMLALLLYLQRSLRLYF